MSFSEMPFFLGTDGLTMKPQVDQLRLSLSKNQWVNKRHFLGTDGLRNALFFLGTDGLRNALFSGHWWVNYETPGGPAEARAVSQQEPAEISSGRVYQQHGMRKLFAGFVIVFIIIVIVIVIVIVIKNYCYCYYYYSCYFC